MSSNVENNTDNGIHGITKPRNVSTSSMAYYSSDTATKNALSKLETLKKKAEITHDDGVIDEDAVDKIIEHVFDFVSFFSSLF